MAVTVMVYSLSSFRPFSVWDLLLPSLMVSVSSGPAWAVQVLTVYLYETSNLSIKTGGPPTIQMMVMVVAARELMALRFTTGPGGAADEENELLIIISCVYEIQNSMRGWELYHTYG